MAVDDGVDSTTSALTQAAHDVSGVAPSVAIELYRRALLLIPLDDDRILDIEVAGLEPLARAGDVDAARAHADELLARFHHPDERRRIHAGLGAVLATAGDLASSTRHYREASADQIGDVALTHCIATGQRVLLGDDPEAIIVDLERALASTADEHVACAAHQGLALATGATCRFDLAVHHALESFRRFDPRTMSRDGFLIPDIWVGSFDAFRDEFDDASLLFERVAYEAERRGELPTLVHTSAALGLVALFRGRWEDAVRELTAVLSIAEETGANAHLVTAHAGLAAIALGRGDEATGRAELEAGHEAMQSGLHLFGVDLQVWLMATESLRAGHADDAYLQLAELWRLTATMRGLTQFRSIAPDLVKTAVATDRPAAATEAVAEVEQIAERSGVTSVVAAAQRCRSLLESDADGLIAAAELLAGTPWRIDHARTCEEAAELLAASGRHDEARGLASRAAAELARIGATSAVARLGRFGHATEGSMRREAAPPVAWDALSPRESEVVVLLAEGLSNPDIAQRLYISRRTVECHVASAMRKLGAANRTQVATFAVQGRVDGLRP